MIRDSVSISIDGQQPIMLIQKDSSMLSKIIVGKEE